MGHRLRPTAQASNGPGTRAGDLDSGRHGAGDLESGRHWAVYSGRHWVVDSAQEWAVDSDWHWAGTQACPRLWIQAGDLDSGRHGAGDLDSGQILGLFFV